MPNRHYRAHQRFDARLPVTITSIQRHVASRGVTVDVGVGGMACELDTPLRLGEPVQIAIVAGTPRLACGQVAWVGWAEASAVRLGVRFDAESADQLEQLLDNLGMASRVGA